MVRLFTRIYSKPHCDIDLYTICEKQVPGKDLTANWAKVNVIWFENYPAETKVSINTLKVHVHTSVCREEMQLFVFSYA